MRVLHTRNTGVFKNKHRFVTATVGALPAQIPVQVTIALTAFDAVGAVVATATSLVSTGGGSRQITATASDQSIASFLLEIAGTAR